MKKWRLSLSSAPTVTEAQPLLLKGSVTDNMRTAAQLGYQAIEVHQRENIDWGCDAILQCEEETGVSISAVVSGRLNTEGLCSLSDDRPYVEQAAVEGMKQYIDLAAGLNTGVILGWIRGSVPAGKEPELYMDRLARNLRILNDYGAQRSVPINIEAINHYEINTFNTVKSLSDFLEEYGLDNCYIHLDTYHMMLEEDDSVQAIRTAGDRLGYFHVADNQRWYPGSGQMDFVPLFEALEEIGYDGFVSLECFPRGDGIATAQKAIEYLRCLMEG